MCYRDDDAIDEPIIHTEYTTFKDTSQTKS
jgi:hypothetical protein